MKAKLNKAIFSLCISLLLWEMGYAQEMDTLATSDYLHVYLDGANDWENYIKVNLWYVDYVRDPLESQVHVLIASQSTASGGLQYQVLFIGKANFEGRNDTLHLIAPIENTNRQTRDQLTNVITMGLMPYLADNGQQKFMFFDYTNKSKLITQSVDKWRSWVFTTTLNTNLSADQTTELFAGDGTVSVAKITDQWKHRITGGLSISNNNYETSTYSFSGQTIIKNFRILTVKSLTDHWSWGIEPAFYASTYSNVKTQFSLAPGIEYDLFPYSQSVNHLFTLRYRIQPLYNTYIDSTVFLKTEEFLLNQILDATYTHIASWGNISSTLTASHYINHSKAYRLDWVNQLNIRVAKGLFFTLTGNISLINNQLTISKVNLKPEEIILQQRETLTNYSYSLQVGIRYTFGSIYNNVVNPRYEGGVNIDTEVINIETPE